jgi:CRP-like cAMP-binding protein
MAGNRLIEAFPPEERRRLLGIAERIELVRGRMLDEPPRSFASVYFPTHGFISLVATLGGKPVAQVGMIGQEGMWGPGLAAGVPNAPLQAMVLGSGSAFRVSAHVFRGEFAGSTAVLRCIDRSLHSLIAQLVSSASCLGFHRIEPRLSRWLLMSQDRAQSDSFFATQKVLSALLGVRRVGVTAAAGELQRRGLIEYTRGYITILDRAGLEAASCSCYASGARAIGTATDALDLSAVAHRPWESSGVL